MSCHGSGGPKQVILITIEGAEKKQRKHYWKVKPTTIYTSRFRSRAKALHFVSDWLEVRIQIIHPPANAPVILLRAEKTVQKDNWTSGWFVLFRSEDLEREVGPEESVGG